MKFAILLQHYFPYGGLQRDALRLARAAKSAGDHPTLIVSHWDGAQPCDIPVIELRSGGMVNHTKATKFSEDCQPYLSNGEYDTSIAFSRVENAPFHFCGDACFRERFLHAKPKSLRFLPRYRYFLDNENKIFGRNANTHIFFLAEREADTFRSQYRLHSERFTVLPPWMNQARAPRESRQQIKNQIFHELKLSQDDKLLLFVGSNFELKQLGSIIKALPQMPPNVQLAICGRDNAKPYQKLAKSLGVNQRVHFMGPRNDIPSWMITADLLVHPSKRETAGMVLIEALTHGLPVTCTKQCGYAGYVAEAGGSLLSEGSPDEIANIAHNMLANLPDLQQKALTWAEKAAQTNTADLILGIMRNYTTST